MTLEGPDNDEWAWLDALVGPVDDDFVKAVPDPVPSHGRNADVPVYKRWLIWI